jgi:hypothetical protein
MICHWLGREGTDILFCQERWICLGSTGLHVVMEAEIARFSIRNKEFGLCWHFFEQTGDGGWEFGFLHLPLE